MAALGLRLKVRRGVAIVWIVVFDPVYVSFSPLVMEVAHLSL